MHPFEQKNMRLRDFVYIALFYPGQLHFVHVRPMKSLKLLIATLTLLLSLSGIVAMNQLTASFETDLDAVSAKIPEFDTKNGSIVTNDSNKKGFLFQSDFFTFLYDPTSDEATHLPADNQTAIVTVAVLNKSLEFSAGRNQTKLDYQKMEQFNATVLKAYIQNVKESKWFLVLLTSALLYFYTWLAYMVSVLMLFFIARIMLRMFPNQLNFGNKELYQMAVGVTVIPSILYAVWTALPIPVFLGQVEFTVIIGVLLLIRVYRMSIHLSNMFNPKQ